MNERQVILLVAPNLSSRMGGEAIKALSLLRQLHADGYDVVQVVHERCRDELTRDYPELDFRFVRDSAFQAWLFRAMPGSWINYIVEAIALNLVARRVAREPGVAIVHTTSPISPVFPHLPIPGAPSVIGPINGNIFHPPGFRHREGRFSLVKRRGFRATQWLMSRFARGKHRADALLVSGGARTRTALGYAGLRGDRLIDTLDSGVAARLEGYAPVVHEGRSGRFVFFGRLVRYKACDLAIRALAAAPSDELALDVVGGGEEEAALKRLASDLGVAERVTFVGWVPNGPELFDRLRSYRGFVYPSLAEANGIVIQEAMLLGLPIVALNWGGAAELLDGDSAMLIEPTDEEGVIAALAAAMTRLAAEPALANRLGQAARQRADAAGFIWPRLAKAWIGIYDRVLTARGLPPLRP
ncbi:glycosyltransferase involved in cell wall biosynthesis [Sphingomonas jinjuensis]|uniref:Glycosyltransferase involved in cell wall biosynthesis n=1 Tax=Sphingomonas jinjuensis TaxID=535907 RepID=A0A840FHZ7_9SPHN|nr:glycosyltransferase family 4 protein [Sphingomonas jinjuensis]MBB4152975.1 glycosyltransferase involved in cell wall biosynthesis [Sphingomonas jinjuensis]